MNAEIAKKLTEAQRVAVLRASPSEYRRAGQMTDSRGQSQIFCKGFLKGPLFESRFRVSHMEYRLTEQGAAIRTILETNHE